MTEVSPGAKALFIPAEALQGYTMTTGALQIWETSLGQLQLQMPRPTYDTWLKGTTGLAMEGDSLTVAVSTPFAAEWLERRMYQVIQRTVAAVAACPLQVRFLVASPQQGSHHVQATEARATMLQPASHSTGSDESSPNGALRVNPINHKYTFQSFVIGQCNQLACAAANVVSQHPGQQYNPLFIYSAVGLGKTHLLHAIASAAVQRNLHAIYTTSEQFTNEFIHAIRTRKMEDFRSKYRSVDVLLLDDIQFLSGKEETQEGFFHTFNDLHNSGRQIVISCDRPPGSVALLEDRLRSRFEWGLITDLQAPDLETRIAILQSKAQAMGCPITEDIALIIAQQAKRNVRELEGYLHRVVALAQFQGKALSIELTRSAMADLVPLIQRAAPIQPREPKEVITQVASYFHISPQALCSQQHNRKTTLPQRISMFLLFETYGHSLDTIAAVMGGWHKRTVHNAITQLNNLIQSDYTLAQDIRYMTQALAAG